MHDLSDEMLCERWAENRYFQYFCGEVVFRHDLPFDRSSLTRWPQRLGAGVELRQSYLRLAIMVGRSSARREPPIGTQRAPKKIFSRTTQKPRGRIPVSQGRGHRFMRTGAI